MSVLVILFFFGLSAGTIGKIKGSSFFIWFCVGFVLPILGTVAAIFWRNERLEPTRQCPECGRTLKLYDQVCNGCGRDLEFPEEPAEVA